MGARTMSRGRLLRSRFLVGLVLLACGCETPSDLEEATFGPGEELLGTELAAGWATTSPTWTPDGEEVVFLDEVDEGLAVHALTVATDEVRSLSVPVPLLYRDSNTTVIPPATGAPLFSVRHSALPDSDGVLPMRLYRVSSPASVPELVTDMRGPWFSVSEDGRHIAFLRDSLVVRDRVSGEERSARAGHRRPGNPFSLSPDGRWLIYADESVSGFGPVKMFSLETEATFDLWPGTEEVEDRRAWSQDVRWQGGTPRLLFAQQEGPRRFSVNRMDGATGRVHRLAEIPDAEALPRVIAWSEDASRVALWAPIETAPCECGVSITLDHLRLYVWTAERGWATAAEAVSIQHIPGWLSFSPDGTTLGYTFMSRLYVERLD